MASFFKLIIMHLEKKCDINSTATIFCAYFQVVWHIGAYSSSFVAAPLPRYTPPTELPVCCSGISAIFHISPPKFHLN